MKSLDLCGPDPRPMTVTEAQALAGLVASIEVPQIIQIGADVGASTATMLEANQNAFIVSIDVKPCRGEFANVQRCGLDPRRVVRLLGLSHEVGAFWPWLCNFLYVDGDHRYEAVVADIDCWASRVIPGGIIAFHDCYQQKPPLHIKSRVRRAVDEWLRQKPGVEEILWTERLRAFRKL